MHSSSLLVIDDNEDDIIMLQEILSERETFFQNVQFIRDVDQILPYLQEQKPLHTRLILLDINMPKMNGWEVLKLIKSQSELKHIPILIYTSSHRQKDILRSYQECACSYICKPNNYQEYLTLFNQLENYWTDVIKTP